MADEITVWQDEATVDQSHVVLIDQTLDTEVVTVEPVIQIGIEEFVLSSGGMYGSNGLIGAVPQWILDAVQQQLTTGDGNLTSVVNDVQALLGTLQTGVSQVVASLNTLSSSTSSITTGLQSQVDINHAEVLNVVATKVDATQAQSIAVNAIGSTFGGDVDAYIGSIASTYTDANSAIAQEVDLMTATLNGVSGSISDISLLVVETVLNPDWVDDGSGTDPDINGEPMYITRAKATKQLQVDANGVISGILLESGATSSVTIQGDQFKLVATGQSVASRNPFTVNATTGEITFNGSVSFNSVTDAPPMVASNTNINVTTNLIPNTGWSVGGYGDYQFFGTPTYYRMIGAGTVAEDTLLLNVGDEVYTPYIEDMTLAYKLSYSFKGANIGSFITVVGSTPTSVDIIPSGTTIDPLKWYNVQLAVLPNGTTGGALFGFVQESATLNNVVVLNDIVLTTGIEKFLIGFVSTTDTYISRVGIEYLTTSALNDAANAALALANTKLSATSDLAALINSGTTTINGSKITTGSITAGIIDANAINGFNINGVNINGAYISGSVIKSSWIDYSSTGDLTNWAVYTTATIPTAYAANFAHNNTTGALVTDGSGYVRLPGVMVLYANSSSTTSFGVTCTDSNIFSWQSYQQSSGRRAIQQLVGISGSGSIYSMDVTYDMWSGINAYVYFKILGDQYYVLFKGLATSINISIIVNKNGSNIFTTTGSLGASLNFNIAPFSFLAATAGGRDPGNTAYWKGFFNLTFSSSGTKIAFTSSDATMLTSNFYAAQPAAFTIRSKTISSPTYSLTY